MDSKIKAFKSVSPDVTVMSDYNPNSNPSSSNEWSNIQAITYDGAPINGSKTKVFAYIGFPNGASPSANVPAVVLVHGGGGHAYAEWVKIWYDRGYAAIAMDTTGYFLSPAGKGLAGREGDNQLWKYGLYGDFAQVGYANAPDNLGNVNSADKPFEKLFMYHAVN